MTGEKGCVETEGIVDSRLPFDASRFTFHVFCLFSPLTLLPFALCLLSRLTFHVSRLTFDASPFTPYIYGDKTCSA